jgi:hypothetical protein
MTDLITTGIHVLDNYEIHFTDHEYYMDFKVFEIVGFARNKETHAFDVPLYGDEFRETTEGVEPFWEGSIKSDGCSNWDFKTAECMAHFCGKDDAISIGRLMAECYDLAKVTGASQPVEKPPHPPQSPAAPDSTDSPRSVA